MADWGEVVVLSGTTASSGVVKLWPGGPSVVPAALVALTEYE